MTFVEQLKAVRRREGYSQAMAAQLIPGLSTRTLQAWECGRQAPPLWAQSTESAMAHLVRAQPWHARATVTGQR